MTNLKPKIMLKISGEAIKNKNRSLFDGTFLQQLAGQIKLLAERFQIAIIVGGGNIWRGKQAVADLHMPRFKLDQIGMLATVMNGLVLQTALQNAHLKCQVFSTIEMPKIANDYTVRAAEAALHNNEIIILCCGVGRPFFTTDTGIALAAAELAINLIMMGKNNVDGVYDQDPMHNAHAVFYPHLTYEELLNQHLQVMDLTAAEICQANNIATVVFKINDIACLTNVFAEKQPYTLICNDKKIKNIQMLLTKS